MDTLSDQVLLNELPQSLTDALDLTKLYQFHKEDDTATVQLDGQVVQVEQANTETKFWDDSSDTGKLFGRNWLDDFGTTIHSQTQVDAVPSQLVTVMDATPWHTQGNRIISPENKPFRITGVNWFGLETETYAPHGLWSGSYQSMMDQMKELGYNTIRLPFSNQLFEEESIPKAYPMEDDGIDFNLNSDLEGLSGLEILDQIVDYAGQIGLHIILDRHRPSADGQSALWYTDAYPEDEWIEDWQMLADRYSNNPTIIGADLHNEPHTVFDESGKPIKSKSATWGSGDEKTDWRLAAERAGNAILEINPNWLIFVEGIQDYEDTNYWWGGNLKGVEDYPVRLNIPDRLVYSAHDYPKSVGDENYPLPWFQETDYPNNLPAVWDSYWGYIHKENIAPVLMGEFGSKYDEADADPQDRQWLEQMVNYLGEGSDGINWTYWAWNPEDEKTGGILQDDWLTINVGKQNLLKQIIFVEQASAPILKTSGTDMVTSDGQPFLIKGIGLGGWLVTEGYMLGISGNEWASQFLPQQDSDPVAGSPSHLRQQLINLVGEQATDTFLENFRNNFITEQDIQQIKDWGFNTLRLPLYYKDLSPQRGQYDEAGFALIDQVLEWAQQYGLYVILDMHAAPGSQNGADHSDGTGVDPLLGGPDPQLGYGAKLWTNTDDQAWLVDIWREIARRYRDNTQIAGYDLLNEPVVTPENSANNLGILRTLYTQIAQAIRSQDVNHILFVEGNTWGTDFSSLKPPFDPNVVYTFHHYGGQDLQNTIANKIKEIRDQLGNVPVFYGEFGENTNTWFSDAIQAAESNNIGWAWWTYKKVDTITSLLSVDSLPQYDKIINYWTDPQTNPKPTPAEAQAGLDALLESSKYDQNLIHADVVASLTDPEFGTINKPFKQLVLPGKIDFINYDLGENNVAYFD